MNLGDLCLPEEFEGPLQQRPAHIGCIDLESLSENVRRLSAQIHKGVVRVPCDSHPDSPHVAVCGKASREKRIARPGPQPSLNDR